MTPMERLRTEVWVNLDGKDGVVVDGVRIVVVRINGKEVRLGFDGPGAEIWRQEIWDEKNRENGKAAS